LRKLRLLVGREGASVREAARRLSKSCTTASKWLAEAELVEPRYPRRVVKSSVLDPFKEQLTSSRSRSKAPDKLLWLQSVTFCLRRKRNELPEIGRPTNAQACCRCHRAVSGDTVALKPMSIRPAN
jgi:transposase